MLRERSEVISFSRDDIERIVRHMAQMQIVGHLFIGKMGEQTVRWTDSGVEVITKYQQGEFEDLPKPEQTALPKRKKLCAAFPPIFLNCSKPAACRGASRTVRAISR